MALCGPDPSACEVGLAVFRIQAHGLVVIVKRLIPMPVLAARQGTVHVRRAQFGLEPYGLVVVGDRALATARHLARSAADAENRRRTRLQANRFVVIAKRLLQIAQLAPTCGAVEKAV